MPPSSPLPAGPPNGAATSEAQLQALDRLQAGEPLSEQDAAALHALRAHLATSAAGGAGPAPVDDDAELDDTQRAYLLSFRDRSAHTGRRYILRHLSEGAGERMGRSASEGLETGSAPELVQQLRQAESWSRFDVLRVAALTEGRPLEAVTMAALRRRDLPARMGLPEEALRSFLQDVERGYRAGQPYHNSTHAADVVQAVSCMLDARRAPSSSAAGGSGRGGTAGGAAGGTLGAELSDLEALALIVAAAVHDLGHPGVNNDFLVRTRAEAALQYNDQSINEHMHLAAAFRLLLRQGNNFLEGLGDEQYRCFRHLVVRCVLGTDMAHHDALLGEAGTALHGWGPALGAWPPSSRVLALQLLLHCADISNCARPLALARTWGARVHEEFFRQGDREAELGLPVTLICDRARASVPKSQLTFAEYFMKPAFRVLGELIPGFVEETTPYTAALQAHWEQQCDAGEAPTAGNAPAGSDSAAAGSGAAGGGGEKETACR